ncbi:hypothetical protein HYDPIDRAFT_170400 [Hydnomerulius pinastri MD-312]|uniref:F-box domain-containing protein n=1 Tax=Hydnomerulius pinastri MD-312 TaxID=994086 RepID=A0A0C9VQW1_9AGAM|nr:hypothetical protein HYDPIDRAFT_170400 [Hydnomerulius pinastri MD-312]
MQRLSVEAVRSICSFLSTESGDEGACDLEGQIALASLARTCKLTHEPALDALWSHLDGFARLVQCLPTDLIECNISVKGPGAACIMISLRRPMGTSDWEVFNRYAIRVRSLGGFAAHSRSPRGSVIAEDSVVHVFAFAPNGPPLLPNLKRLAWDCLKGNSLPLFRLLLSNRLHSVHLRPAVLDYCALTALGGVGSACPALRDLVIVLPDSQACKRQNSRGTMAAVLRLLSDTPRIETISISEVDLLIIQRLALMPSIMSMDLGLTHQYPTDSQPLGVPPGSLAFSTLRVFSLRCHISQAAAFLATILESSCPTLSLRAITVKEPSSRTVQKMTGNSSVIDITHLRIMFHFTHLQELDLDLTRQYSFDDDTIRDLAIAWPHLETLHLNKSRGWGVDDSQITFSGLRCLLMHCRSLKSLALELDFDTIEDVGILEQCPCDGVSNKLIRTLWLGYSIISEPLTVVTYLAAVLPRLETTHAWEERPSCSNGPCGTYRPLWATPKALLPTIAAIRKQGKGCSCTSDMKMEI